MDHLAYQDLPFLVVRVVDGAGSSVDCRVGTSCDAGGWVEACQVRDRPASCVGASCFLDPWGVHSCVVHWVHLACEGASCLVGADLVDRIDLVGLAYRAGHGDLEVQAVHLASGGAATSYHYHWGS